MKIPRVATKLKEVLDTLKPSELLTSAELAAAAGLGMVGRGGYGGTLNRLAAIYLPDYTAKVGKNRYWGAPASIQELKSTLGEAIAN